METSLITPADIVTLMLVPGAGRHTVHRALGLAKRSGKPVSEWFGIPERILLQQALPGDERAAAALHRCGPSEVAEAGSLLGLCAQQRLHVLTCADPGYPRFLNDTLATQAPPILFYQGNEALMGTTGAAVVGTRRPTDEAIGWARATARTIAGEGVPLVSGGADGIDLAAHAEALEAGGLTTVILPEGLHGHYPHPVLQRGLDAGQVLLLSEFLPLDPWQTHRAMTRNRSIAAFSHVVCVIEPREKGGSMFTAEQALAQHKPVYYWGGACRDGSLRGRHGAHPLVAGGHIAPALVHAAFGEPPANPRQADLFES